MRISGEFRVSEQIWGRCPRWLVKVEVRNKKSCVEVVSGELVRRLSVATPPGPHGPNKRGAVLTPQKCKKVHQHKAVYIQKFYNDKVKKRKILAEF